MAVTPLQEGFGEGPDMLEDPPEVHILEAHGGGLMELEERGAGEVLEHLPMGASAGELERERKW